VSPTRQRPTREWVYVARHINGQVVRGTLDVIWPNKTLSRCEALEQVNKWNRLSCKEGEPCLWTYYLEGANGKPHGRTP
jgi:hypothetical protein